MINRKAILFLSAIIFSQATVFPVYASDIPVETTVEVESTTDSEEETEVDENLSEDSEYSDTLSGEGFDNSDIEEDTSSYELEEVDKPVTTPAPKKNASKNKEKKEETVSTAEKTKWDISERGFNHPASTTRKIYVGSGVNRFEIFYTANSTKPPEIVFKSLSGNPYILGRDTEYGETKFVTRGDNIMADYPDLKYIVLYIANPEDPGEWEMGVTLNDNINEFIMVTTKAPDNWENIICEYKTLVKTEGPKLWGIDTKKSNYTSRDIAGIVSKDKEIPQINNMQAVPEEELNKKPETNPMLWIITLVIIAIVAGTVGVIFLFKKMDVAHEAQKKYAIKNANARVKKRQEIENKTLDKVIKKYDDDYSDDDVDTSEYLSFSDEYLEPEEDIADDSNLELNFDDDEINSFSVPKDNAETSNNYSYTPAWEKETLDGTTALTSWEVADDDEDDTFF